MRHAPGLGRDRCVAGADHTDDLSQGEILADPIALNARLGIYTNFVNLMGLCGVAVPNGFRADGCPRA